MVKVVWTASALEDLDNIGEYISKDSLKYAIITVEELFESVDILEDHPRAGPVVPEFNKDSLRQLIRNGYRIVYRIIDEHRIDILTVHSCFRLLVNTKPFKEE
jgi:addiction module RelE/StbE family toxin